MNKERLKSIGNFTKGFLQGFFEGMFIYAFSLFISVVAFSIILFLFTLMIDFPNISESIAKIIKYFIYVFIITKIGFWYFIIKSIGKKKKNDKKK